MVDEKDSAEPKLDAKNVSGGIMPKNNPEVKPFISDDLRNTLMSIATTPLLIYIKPESHVFEYNRIMTNALDGTIKINLLSMTGCSNGIVTDFVGEDGRRYRNTLEVLDD